MHFAGHLNFQMDGLYSRPIVPIKSANSRCFLQMKHAAKPIVNYERLTDMT